MPVECPRCHQANRDNDEFCCFCGARLTIPIMPIASGVESVAEQSFGLGELKSDVDPALPQSNVYTLASEGLPNDLDPAAQLEPHAFLEVEGGQEIFFRGAYTTRVPIKTQSILIGRRDVMANHYPDIDLMMYRKLDPAISRRHLRIFRESETHYVEDLCNNNATFLNDYSNKLNHERRELRDGDRIFVSMSLALLFRLQD